MLKTKHLSIMFTDMKGFTTKAATQSRQQLQHLLELQDDIIKPAIKHFDGTIVKTIGDAFLVTFESPTDAVLCGMKIQENILNHNARATSSDQMEVRIAINSGEVNIKDGDVFGEPVNIASRIEAIAEPNEIYFTEAVYLTMNKNEIPTAEVGHRKLKGIPEEIKVYKVMSEQTNLIRAKIKREQMAMANANLAKDEVNFVEGREGQGGEEGKDGLLRQVEEKKEPAPEIKKELLELEKEGAQVLAAKSLMPESPIKKSLWQKHKKKIIIIVFIILFLLLITIAKEKERLQNELNQTQYPALQLQEKLPQFEMEFNQALTDQNWEKIKQLTDTLNYFVANAPQELKPQISKFINEKLNNPALKPAQRQELKKILDQL